MIKLSVASNYSKPCKIYKSELVSWYTLSTCSPITPGQQTFWRQSTTKRAKVMMPISTARHVDYITWATHAIWTQLYNVWSISSCCINTMSRIRPIWSNLTLITKWVTEVIWWCRLQVWYSRCGTPSKLWFQKDSSIHLERSMNSSVEMINRIHRSISTSWLMAFMKKPTWERRSHGSKTQRAKIEHWRSWRLSNGLIIFEETGHSSSLCSMARWSQHSSAWPARKNQRHSTSSPISRSLCLSHLSSSSTSLSIDCRKR